VISSDGSQLGIMTLDQARLKAQELQLDLVEVNPTASPPVCKIMDYGKRIYKSQKKQGKTASRPLKEIRMKPRTGEHDLDVKMRHARKLLSKGHRIQLTMVYRGREMAHQEIGHDILDKAVAKLEDACKVERGLLKEGKRASIIVGPIK